MITEIFSLLSSMDIMEVGEETRKKFSVNLNRNRIRSISTYSSNSIFYFPTIVSDQITPEEMGMCSKFLEKSYASFVVACIGLMPFHRVKAGDAASIEEYLRQFHQNLGISGGGDRIMGRLLDWSTTLEENASLPDDPSIAGKFLLECWEKSRKADGNPVRKVPESTPLVRLFSRDPIDPATRHLCEAYRDRMEELETWGFVGEATEDMFDAFDDLGVSDEELERILGGGAGYDMDEHAAAREDVSDTKSLGPGRREEVREKEEEDSLNEGSVRKAINQVSFSLEAVPENKILSCDSLGKLRSLEAKLNKLKNKYAKYLNRYKRKHKENKENGTNKKLSIRFNGMAISDPKAFMQQYGAFIKIINRRLKLVEKRRAELRERKGISVEESPTLESAMPPIGISETDLLIVEQAVEEVTRLLNAPDSEAFLMEDAKDDEIARLETKIQALQASNDYYRSIDNTRTLEVKDAREQARLAGDRARTAEQNAFRAERIATNARDSASKMKKQADAAMERYGNARQQLNDIMRNGTPKQRQEAQRLRKRIEELEKREESDSTDFRTRYRRNPMEKQEDGLVYDRGRSVSNVNVAAAAAAGYSGHATFGKEIFTSMDLKKANEAVPTFARATIGFIVDETEQVVSRDVLVGIKVQLHRVPAVQLVDDIYQAIGNKRKFLKFVKFISGEEKSLADLLFGFRELKADAVSTKRPGVGEWLPAFRRRKRWKNMSVPYLMKEYTPNGTLVLTMNEVQFIKDEYGIDIMTPAHVEMLMDQNFLLGFVVLDQSNEMAYITYDGHGGHFQQYTYSMLEREQQTSDRMVRELYRSIAR